METNNHLTLCRRDAKQQIARNIAIGRDFSAKLVCELPRMLKRQSALRVHKKAEKRGSMTPRGNLEVQIREVAN